MTTDVIVVGAGPTGLLLAGDLAEAGIGVTVLERRVNESNLTRAFGVHARTMEELDIRGLADELLETGQPVSALRLFDHVRVDLSKLPTRYGYLLITPQYNVEQLLQERADRLGVTIEHGAAVVGLAQDTDGVTVEIQGADGGVATRRARYVVGADGVHSKVRELLGLPFPGKAIVKSIMLADVRLTTPPEDVLTVNAVGDGFAFVAPFGDGWYRVFAWDRRNQVPDDAPLELGEIRDVVRRALGTDLGMHDPRWMSRFHSDERQVPEYRVGRVFLAGDAAHCHSPAGGQGMNTGMQDAANLSWKLAAVLKGRASESLLDTYHEERHPVGAMVLRSSGAIIRMAMIKSRLGRALRNAVGSIALRQSKIALKAAGNVSGIGIHYGQHTRMADLPLAKGRLHEALRGGHFVLIANEPLDGVPAYVHTVKPANPVEQPILVRPDGYLAHRGDPREWFDRWCPGAARS
jgi:2-polyprenyl-6-methoxyphenol hydroxylase-like FAD-dependent oxidoreductase